jgi:hypothetical protein
MKSFWFIASVSAALAIGLSPAHATFIMDPNPGGEKFFNGDANKDVTSFVGTVGGQHSGPEVMVEAIGPVDTGAGFANIKPVKDGVLVSLTFTPADGNLFKDFSFRGQLVDDALGQVIVSVQDNQGGLPQDILFTGLGSNADFARIGIVAVAGSGETIQSVSLTSIFKEVKQIEFSLVPEPQTYAILGLGLALAGIALRRRHGIGS